MTRALKIRQQVMWRTDDWDTDTTWMQRMLCLLFGHDPERDQCSRPEHDFCLWCMKLMPHAADAIVAKRRADRIGGAT